MKQIFSYAFIFLFIVILFGTVKAAYHHEGEADTPKFTAAYPQCKDTKLDSCALCHTGGKYEKEPGQWVTVGSCQWCHREEVYGYKGKGNIDLTLNSYGRDYKNSGRNTGAFSAIESKDSDEDGYTNKQEIEALHYPGDAGDDPTKRPAPQVTYSPAEIESLPQHKQFLLMNTSRRGDLYGEYEGTPMADLLDDAGILDNATSITVFSPDGYFYTNDLYPGGDYYYVYGTYPQAPFYYAADADVKNGGWCDYASPGATGRSNGDIISVAGGLQLMLAYKRDGAYMEPGFLDETNRLDYDAEGPYRIVPPQMAPGPPDQSATSAYQNVTWPYDEKADHNSGYSCRAAVAIRIEPLPEGTVDFNWNEDGWHYVDAKEVIIYGAIASGDIAGTVTDNETGAAIAGATAATGTGGYSATTDAGGSYDIKGIKPGSYSLTVAASGYQSQTRRVAVVKGGMITVSLSLKKAIAPACPAEQALAGEIRSLKILRRFRDEILLSSAQGKGCVAAYYRHAPEIVSLTVSSEALRNQLQDVLHLVLPDLENALRGKGLTLSQQHSARITGLLDAYAEKGSSSLQAAIRQMREALAAGARAEKNKPYLFNPE